MIGSRPTTASATPTPPAASIAPSSPSWVFDQTVWPRQGIAPLPNPDTPEDIRRDYEEASTILDLSPRGAAALLRLAVQKLCAHLGEKGKNINDDIAALVAKGLDPRVQQALDVGGARRWK